MKKQKMHSGDGVHTAIAHIRDLFPGCVREALDPSEQTVRLKVDFDQLRRELGGHIVEGQQERYRLDWPGKKDALAHANAPVNKSLRPAIEKSINFDKTGNLFVEGENLDVIKLMQESYLGRIKLIYIDPPYNTGSDLIYKDNFRDDSTSYLIRSKQVDASGNRLVSNPETGGRFHSNWLSMIYARLRVARNLLSDDGAIAIHIDEHEYPNLEKVLAEIFGEGNNLGTIVWDKRNPKGDATRVAQQHEYVSLYAKNFQCFRQDANFKRPKANAQKILRKAERLIKKHKGVNVASREAFRKWLAAQKFSGGEKAYSFIDDNGDVYQSVSMAWPNGKLAPDEYFIPLVHPTTGKECPVPERGWRNPPKTMQSLLDKGEIIFGLDETTQPRRKYLLRDNLAENIGSVMYFGGSDVARFAQMNLVFDNPKPLAVARQIIEFFCSDDDIILDFFGGSATSAHAVMDLNAANGSNMRFMQVQLPEPISRDWVVRKTGCRTIAELGRERIRKAGRELLLGDCHPDWKQDVGFRTLVLDSPNMKEVVYRPDETKQSDMLELINNVKEGRSDEDLLFQVMTDWGMDLLVPIKSERLHDKMVFFVDDMSLVACFDVGVPEDLAKELARLRPSRMVFRDHGFVSDAAKTNIEQIFRQVSPNSVLTSL